MFHHLIVLCLVYYYPLSNAIHNLESISYVDLAKQEYNKRLHLWNPPTPDRLKPDFRLFQLTDLTQFEAIKHNLLHLIQTNHPSGHFKWTTVSLYTTKYLNKSYVLLGGSAQRSLASDGDLDVSPRDGGTMFLCELISTQNAVGFGPGPNGCTVLSPATNGTSKHEFLGSSSSAITLDDERSILAFCDPLWRAESHVPVGRCFLSVMREGRVERSLELSEFCQSGLTVATPCMAGHSVALSMRKAFTTETDMKSRLKSLRVWVGEPLSVPEGRIEIVSDPFYNSIVTTVNRPEVSDNLTFGAQFGFTIADGFATAPQILMFPESQNTTIAQLIGIQTDGTATQHLNYIDWIGGVNSTDIFSGFGISMIRIALGKFGRTALIIGAPYQSSPDESDETSKSRAVNRGRLYLFCPQTSQSTSRESKTQFVSYSDFVDGAPNTSFLGFSLSVLSKPMDDGSVLIAAGAPDLDNRLGYSQVYILRILPTCSFDKTPVQIIQSLGSQDFGATLPASGVDIDFNNWVDFVVPFSVESHPAPTVSFNVIASRPRLRADCRFNFPPWLSIRRILTGDTLPIMVSIYFSRYDKVEDMFENAIQRLFAEEEMKRLIHQVAVDWNTTKGNPQRFKLQGQPKSGLDRIQGLLSVEFKLTAQQDVQDMLDIDSPTKGLFVGYRFLQSCSDSLSSIDEEGTCPGGSGINLPLIDWSSCVTLVPLTRFVCYPHPNCESDVHLNVTHVSPSKSISRDTSNVMSNGHPGVTNAQLVDLIYGEANNSEPELLITLFNYGPTFAGGVWLELQFHGNLRFSRLRAYETQEDLASELDANVRVDVSSNETWASCYLDYIPAPDSTDGLRREDIPAMWYVKLSTYYPKYISTEGINFTLGAGLTIRVITGTLDPVPSDNVAQINYRVVSDPKLRLSFGPEPVTSRMDNRTKPPYLGTGFQRRVEVDEIGPRVEHTVQVEYLGPTKKLSNVTFRMFVPQALALSDQQGIQEAYIVYMFPEIRASVDGIGGLQWIDLLPKLTTKEDTAGVPRLGTCAVMNAKETLNPLNMIGMDIRKTYSRTRRQAIPNFEDDDASPVNTGARNQSIAGVSGESLEETSGSFPTGLFRRIPKEILQCDRVGYRLEQPVCAEIVCHLDELPKNRPVLITVTGWLWARTFFDKHISDVEVVTTLSVDQGTLPEGVIPAPEPVGYFHVGQTFFFPQIRPKLIHQIPTWPIIVGVVLGIIFLALLVILLYCLGFFKRRKPPLNKAHFSKGGADELERDAEDTPVRKTQYAGFQTTKEDKYERGAKRKRRGKHRAELTILHPADLGVGQHSPDGQQLLDDSAEHVNESGQND